MFLNLCLLILIASNTSRSVGTPPIEMSLHRQNTLTVDTTIDWDGLEPLVDLNKHLQFHPSPSSSSTRLPNNQDHLLTKGQPQGLSKEKEKTSQSGWKKAESLDKKTKDLVNQIMT